MTAGRRRSLPALALAGLLLALPAAAADRDAVAFARATALARAGHCPEALVALAEMRAPTAPAAHLRGQCQLEARDYPAALASFEEAKRLDPGTPGLALHLAVARFYMGDYAGASEALDAAAPSAQDDPQYHLYRGLVLLQQAQSEEAAAELERARTLGPGIDPGASYYEGLAWVGADEREKANEALDRVIRMAPGSVWAQQAERAKLDYGRPGTSRGRLWAFARVGLEYDSNVLLRAPGVELPENVSGQHDLGAVALVNGGVQLAGGRDWAAGLQGTYYGSAYFHLSDYDQHYPVVGLWFDRRVADATVARLSYDVGYAWYDGNPFAFTQQVRPALYHDFGEAGRSQLFASVYQFNYLYGIANVQNGPGTVGAPCADPNQICGPAGLNEAQARNRDGWGVNTGVEHTLPIPRLSTDLYGGVGYLRYASRGSEYSFQGVGTWIGTETSLPFDSFLRVQAGFAYLPFLHPSTYPEPGAPGLVAPTTEYPLANVDRHDDRWTVQVELEKFLTDSLSVSARWSYLDNNSNVGVFDYDRQTIGAYVTYRLAR